MTENEWLACNNPAKLLEFLRGKASERKLRLFACACCRRIQNLLSDKYSRKALTIAERYAEAEVSADKLRFAWGDARRAAGVAYREDRETAEASAMWAVSLLCEADIGRALGAVELAGRCEAYPIDQPRLAVAEREQMLLLRDVMSNPFRPVSIDPAWRRWQDGTIPKLAFAVYNDRAYDQLPILADALEVAGCQDDSVLTHCRGPGPHVRGCWVVDLLLGKQ
jgi:hypothetical protein